jgi:O-antigen/teichoic acid export membrane protein
VAVDVSSDNTDTPGDGRPAGRHTVGRNMAAMASAQLVTWMLGTIIQLVQPRFLGPEGLGRIQLAFSLWMIAMVVVDLGTGTYLTLKMARDDAEGRRLVGPIVLLRLGAFGIACFAMAGYAAATDVDREMALLLAISAITMLLQSLQGVLLAAFQGLERMSQISIATVASKVAHTVLMIIVLSSGGGVIGLAWVTVVQAALGGGLLAYFYRDVGRISFTWPIRGYGSIVRSSAMYMVGGVILTVYMQIDMVVMSLLVDDETLGWYTSADVLVHSLLFIPSIILTVLFPVIGRLHASDAQAVNLVVQRAFSVLTLTGIPIGFGVAVIGEPFAVLLFGEPFRGAGIVLSVFGLTLPLIFLTMLLGNVAYATGRERFWSLIMGVAVVASIAFDLVFVPVFDRVADNGAIAGALGYVVTEGLMVLVAIRRITPELFSGATLVRICKLMVAAGLMFVAATPLRDLFIVVPVAVGAAVFVASVLAFRVLTDDDRYLMAILATRTIGRVPLIGSFLPASWSTDERPHQQVGEGPTDGGG